MKRLLFIPLLFFFVVSASAQVKVQPPTGTQGDGPLGLNRVESERTLFQQPANRIKAYGRKAQIPAKSQVEETIIYDDGNAESDTFFGFGDGGEAFLWGNEFLIEGNDFTLSTFDFYMRTEGEARNLLTVTLFGTNNEVLVTGDLDLEPFQDGTWYFVQLENPITFSDGESFFVEFSPSANISFPAGIDAGAQVSGRSWFRQTGGDYANLTEVQDTTYRNGAFLVRAIGDRAENTGNNISFAHTPPGSATAGEALPLSVDVTGDNVIASVAVAYLEGGSSATPQAVLLSNTGGSTWEGSIPGTAITANGLIYALGIADEFDNSTASVRYGVPVQAAEGLSQNIASGGTDSTAYRLVSIPLQLDNANPASIFEDDLGEYNPENWRLFTLRADQSYAEVPSTGSLSPGTGFWLATSESGQSFSTGSGSSLDPLNPFTIGVNAGWTFIGNPFNFPVPLGQLALASGEPLDIRRFNGQWSTLTGSLQPFEGYAIASTAASQLIVLPEVGIAKQDPSAASEPAAHDWAIRIRAEAGSAIDQDNLAAVNAASSPDHDFMDRPEPPVIGDYVSVYFPHRDWDVPFSRFSTDVRTEQGKNAWYFEVVANTSTSIPLSFEGLDTVPAEYEIWLVDHLLNHKQNLREHSVYQMSTSEESVQERFELIVSRPELLDHEALVEEAVPSQNELTHFPNPFAELSTLRYGLAQDAPVHLSVYDILGKQITTLVSGKTQAAGYHAVTWDGRGDSGAPVANGVYFYVLRAGDQVRTERVVMLR